MSNVENDKLLERAGELIDLYTSTPVADILEFDIQRGDLEALRSHVREAESMLESEPMV